MLVLGAGVAGLQAICTARRLGAVVSAYDVRPAARHEIASVGATFLDLVGSLGGADEGGVRPSAQHRRAASASAEALAPHVARADIVITTAQVPGRTPPLLVSDEARQGHAARLGDRRPRRRSSRRQRRAQPARPDRRCRQRRSPSSARTTWPRRCRRRRPTPFSRNVSALLRYLVHDGVVRIDATDEVQAGMLAVHEGRITDPRWNGTEWKGTPQ